MPAALPSYVGDCSWQPSGNPEPSDPPNELPTTTEPWMGRSDQTASFRAAYFVGKPYLGGFITANTPKSNGFCPGIDTCDLVIARPPDFQKFLSPCSTAVKTGTKTAAGVAVTGVIPGASTVDASREVSYYAPETSYSYFAVTLPTAPRFTTVAVATQPRVIRSVIRASAGGVEKVFSGALAPAGLVTALFMPVADKLTSFSPEPIPGTPWYRCTDMVTRELTGDT